MQYLLLCCFNEDEWQALPQSRRETIMGEYHALVQNLTESGHYLAGGKLESTAAASTVRGRDGKATITDGPFAETREQLGGYHLLECRDLDEARSIASRIPTIAYGGVVEVRPMARA